MSVVLPCEHEMHRACWHNYASMHAVRDPSCPLCRRSPAARPLARFPPHDDASNLTVRAPRFSVSGSERDGLEF